MADFVKVTIETDTAGRLFICASTEGGGGHGHRFAGPKFSARPGVPAIVHELDAEDVREIRAYLAIWDKIHAPATAESGGA